MEGPSALFSDDDSNGPVGPSCTAVEVNNIAADKLVQPSSGGDVTEGLGTIDDFCAMQLDQPARAETDSPTTSQTVEESSVNGVHAAVKGLAELCALNLGQGLVESVLTDLCNNSSPDVVNGVCDIMGIATVQDSQMLEDLYTNLPDLSSTGVSVDGPPHVVPTSATSSAETAPTYCELGVSVSTNHLMPTPTASCSDYDPPPLLEQEAPLPAAPPTLDPPNPTQMEIDSAILTVLEDFNKITPKENKKLLDAEILQTCLDNILKSPTLLCNQCLEVFHDMGPYQSHIQTCTNPAYIQLKYKMDQISVDMLASSLWKGVFINKLKHIPAANAFIHREDLIRDELSKLWKSCTFDSVIKCRSMYIRLAVDLGASKWTCNALANSIQTAKKPEPKKRAKPEVKIEDVPSTDVEGNQPKASPASKKRKRNPKKATVKKSETDLAVEALEADVIALYDEMPPSPVLRTKKRGAPKKKQPVQPPTTIEPEPVQQPYRMDLTPLHEPQDNQVHTMPDTPISMAHQMTPHLDRLADMVSPDLMDDQPHNITPEPEEEDVKPVINQYGEIESLDNDCIDLDIELDRFVRNGVDREQAAAAAQEFEKLGEFEADEGSLSENEYLVDKILDRRLICKVEGFPEDKDYEYLVSWVGYSADEQSWEPFRNLTHCTEKLEEFRSRLTAKAMRNRPKGGKRI